MLFFLMTEKDNNVKEVSIVKRSTTMTSEEFVSITLKSADDTVESLLQKAISATSVQKNILENKIPLN